jgi:2,3-dihydroxybenzoate-AMP ligase
MTTRATPRPLEEGLVPWPEEFARRYVAEGYWIGQPLGAALRRAGLRTPEALALVDGTTRLTFRSLLARADGLAVSLLEDLGLQPGDRLLVQLPNCWQFVVLTLACLRAGVVPVMALPAHRERELGELAAHSEAVAVAVPEVHRGVDHLVIAEAITRAPGSTLRSVLVVGEPRGPSQVDLTAWCAEPPDPEACAARLDAQAPTGRQVALFLLSGGTTGTPKLIPRTHDDYGYNARASAELCRLGPGDAYLVALPGGHNFPLACPGILGTVLRGGRVVMLDSPEPERAFATIAAERVTVTAVVPAVAQRWLTHAEAHGADQLESLRLLQVGGARLAEEVARRVEAVLGVTLQQVFGMAEGLVNYTRLDDPKEVRCATQGRPLSPGDEIRVVDEAGRDVPPGVAGLLLTRGPYTIRGYYRAPEHNARSFDPDGWYRTGDVVVRRDDGNLVVEGREKDIVNRGGEKISAEEVENLAYRLSGVRQCAAVAVPDPELGERVCLFAVLAPGTTLTLAGLRAALAPTGVSPLLLPERLELVDQLPTTAVGKIDKAALRAEAARRAAAEDRERRPR